MTRQLLLVFVALALGAFPQALMLAFAFVHAEKTKIGLAHRGMPGVASVLDVRAGGGEGTKGGPPYLYLVDYEFQPKGIDVTATSSVLVDDFPDIAVGDRVVILYDPREPHRSKILRYADGPDAAASR